MQNLLDWTPASPVIPEEDGGNDDLRMQMNDLKELVNKLIPDSTGKGIERTYQSIFPLCESIR
jgi:hypothetical protein